MKKMMTILVAVCLIAAVGSMAYAGASGISDPTITVTQFTTPDTLRDKTHETVDSIDTAVKAVIDELDKTTDGSGNLTAAETVTVTDIPAGEAGVFLVDVDAAGANTNLLMSIGATITIGADGDGTLIETNTAAAAEYCIGILINGARYNILLEKP